MRYILSSLGGKYIGGRYVLAEAKSIQILFLERRKQYQSSPAEQASQFPKARYSFLSQREVYRKRDSLLFQRRVS
jgi:hypothetical protein